MDSSLHLSSIVRRLPPTPAPPGTVIDYDSTDNIGNRLIIASWTTLTFALLAVSTRFISKAIDRKSRPTLDDYFSLLALLFAAAKVGCNAWEVWVAGVGRHVWDVRPQYYHRILNTYEIGNVIYLFGIMFAKMSILVLLYYIFGRTNRRFCWACYVLAFIVFGYCLGCALAILFACRPEATTWNRDIPGTCINLATLNVTVGALNITTDTVIFILPIPTLMKLQLNLRKKIELLSIFGTGSFVIATTIIREVIVIKTLRDFDQTRAIIPDMTWLTVELNIGIVCGCLPGTRSLISRIGETPFFTSLHESLSRLTSRTVNKPASQASSLHDKHGDKIAPSWHYIDSGNQVSFTPQTFLDSAKSSDGEADSTDRMTSIYYADIGHIPTGSDVSHTDLVHGHRIV